MKTKEQVRPEFDSADHALIVNDTPRNVSNEAVRARWSHRRPMFYFDDGWCVQWDEFRLHEWWSESPDMHNLAANLDPLDSLSFAREWAERLVEEVFRAKVQLMYDHGYHYADSNGWHFMQNPGFRHPQTTLREDSDGVVWWHATEFSEFSIQCDWLVR